jgi:hypothetical protein
MRPRLICAATLALVAGLAVPTVAPARAAPRDPATGAAISRVSPAADRILRRMSDYLKSLEEFTFRSRFAEDEVLPSGQKIQYTGQAHVAVRRPDRLHVERHSNVRRARLVYDGERLTLHDLDVNVYSTADVPPTIDAALDETFDRFGISPPGADLVYADPYATLIEAVQSGVVIGMNEVAGVMCHHLAFTQEAIDWQVWIEAGARPLPRKFVITHKDELSSPQYIAVLTDWNLHPRIADDHFVFHPPAGADEIDFIETEWEGDEDEESGS